MTADLDPVEIARDAVRDEVGSRLCRWDRDVRSCEISICLCQAAGRAAISALELAGARIMWAEPTGAMVAVARDFAQDYVMLAGFRAMHSVAPLYGKGE